MGEMPLIRKIIAFVLTFVAVPMLFAGTCMRIGVFAHGRTTATVFLVTMLSFMAVFIVAAIAIAIRTRNPGIRWAIIVHFALGIIAAAGASLYFIMR